MFRNYNFNEIDELEKFKEDVQAFILKLDKSKVEVIKTSKGYPVIIDKDIADEVKKYTWYGNDNLGGAYALRKIKKENQYLQNFVWKLKTGRPLQSTLQVNYNRQPVTLRRSKRKTKRS